MVLTFIGGLLGGLFSHIALKLVNTIFANARRREEDLDNYLEDLRQALDRLVEDCEQYWSFLGDTPPPDEAVRAARIVATLHDINGLALSLFQEFPSKWELTRAEWAVLYESASGGEFKNPERSPDPDRLQAIALHALALKRDVRVRRNQIRSRWFD
jgi:hypothetical protein